jgi:dihydrofolate reductase
MIIGIVAVDTKWGIGKNNDLLFHLKKDMEWFKLQTSGSIVVCGYNTLLSFPGSKPLKGRTTICLCPEDVERNDCFCIHDFNKFLSLVKELSKTQNVYVIGGAMLYKSMLPYYDQVYVTKVDADGEAEVFFPNLDNETDFIQSTIQETFDGDYFVRFTKYTRKQFTDILEK